LVLVDGESDDDSPSIWLAQIVEVNLFERTLEVIYYEEINEKYKKNNSKVYTIGMDTVLLLNARLTQNQTIYAYDLKRAHDFSVARSKKK
jgi:hypothetical protein